MLDTKALLAKIVAWINGFTVQTVALPSTTLASGATTAVSVSVALSGYKPTAIIGISKGGAGNGQVAFSGYYISGTTAWLTFVNTASASRTFTSTIYVLYTKA